MAQGGDALGQDPPVPLPGSPRPAYPTPGGEAGLLDLNSWSFTVGGLALVHPTYEGSDSMGVMPFPLLSAQYKDRFTLDSRGASATVFNRGPFTLRAMAGFDMGRAEDDDDHLNGLGDIGMAAVLGMGAQVELGPAELRAEVRRTLGGDNGFTGELGTSVKHALTPSLMLEGDGSLTFADSNHMESYFGVDAGQSARSGLSQYTPDPGLKRLDLKIAATYSVTNNWFVRGEAGLGLLVGDAADSPIVRQTLQPSTMLGVGYRF